MFDGICSHSGPCPTRAGRSREGGEPTFTEDGYRIREIQKDPVLTEIASRYLKRKPNILASRMWWSFPVDRFDKRLLRIASQSLHFDMNDWSSVKFFFYLTDVSADSGPHVYVRRSHRRKRLRDQFTLFAGKRISEVIDFYGAGNFATICGPAGFGFTEGAIPV
jgi:hypothetical protein